MEIYFRVFSLTGTRRVVKSFTLQLTWPEYPRKHTQKEQSTQFREQLHSPLTTPLYIVYCNYNLYYS